MARPVASRTPLSEVLPALYGPDGRRLPASVRPPGDVAGDAGPPVRAGVRRQPARAFIPPQTFNLQTTIRSEDPTAESFALLRELAAVDMVQAATYVIVGQILGMDWEARVLPEFEHEAEKYEDEVERARAFLVHPDPLRGRAGRLRPWLSLATREVVVTDAFCTYPRRTRGGDPIGLSIVDGATIKPQVDGLGNPLQPPEAAFVQYVRGRPERGFELGELWYSPMHPQVGSPYGQSYVERVKLTLNTAILYGLHDIEYFTSGNTPDSFYAPDGIHDPEALEAFQESFDTVHSARSDRRAGNTRMVPPGTYTPTKVREWQYEFPEFLMRLIGMAFQVSTTAIQKQANRSTAEVQGEAQLEAGTMPVAALLAEVLTDYAQRVIGAEHVCIGPAQDETVDPELEHRQDMDYFDRKVIDANELRAKTGRPPREDEAEERVDFQRAFAEMVDEDNRGIYTVNDIRAKTGDEPVAGSDGEQRVRIPTQGATPPSPQPPRPPGGTEGGPPEIDGLPREPRDVTFQDDPEDADEDAEVEREIAAWLGVARRRAQRGKPPRPWRDSKIAPVVRARIEMQLRKATTAAEVSAVFKADPTAEQRRLEEPIREAVAAWLASITPGIVALALDELDGATSKMTIPLPEASVRELWEQLVEGLTAAALSGAVNIATGIGANLSEPAEGARAFALERAAELLGRTLVDGELIESTNPTFAITETVRADVERAIRTAIDEQWSPTRLRAAIEGQLGFERADTVARTEAAFAQGQGALQAYEEIGVQRVRILDGRGCLPSGHRDGAPRASGRPGVVEREAEADGQVWTLEQYEQHVIGHPNCTRASAPEDV